MGRNRLPIPFSPLGSITAGNVHRNTEVTIRSGNRCPCCGFDRRQRQPLHAPSQVSTKPRPRASPTPTPLIRRHNRDQLPAPTPINQIRPIRAKQPRPQKQKTPDTHTPLSAERPRYPVSRRRYKHYPDQIPATTANQSAIKSLTALRETATDRSTRCSRPGHRARHSAPCSGPVPSPWKIRAKTGLAQK